jgi:hypothetical protein
MYRGKSIRVELLADGIAELSFDREGEAINKFDRHTVAELQAATAAIRGAANVRGVLVSSSKNVFIVGADIFEFSGLFALPEAEIATAIAGQARRSAASRTCRYRSTAINGLRSAAWNGAGLEPRRRPPDRLPEATLASSRAAAPYACRAGGLRSRSTGSRAASARGG